MRQFGLLALCLLAAPVLVGAQTSEAVVEWAPPDSWLETQSARCGEVVGRVVRRASAFDATDTRVVPLARAFVAVVDSGPTHLAPERRDESVAVTDAAGEFRLRLSSNRTTVLEVKAVGYEPALVAVDGTRYRAAVVEVGLGSMGFHVPHRGASVLASRGLTACAP